MGKGVLTLTLDTSEGSQCETKSAWRWEAHATVNPRAAEAPSICPPYTEYTGQEGWAASFTCIAEVQRKPVFNTGLSDYTKSEVAC